MIGMWNAPERGAAYNAQSMYQQDVHDPHVYRDNSYRGRFNPTDLPLIKDLPKITTFRIGSSFTITSRINSVICFDSHSIVRT